MTECRTQHRVTRADDSRPLDENGAGIFASFVLLILVTCVVGCATKRDGLAPAESSYARLASLESTRSPVSVDIISEQRVDETLSLLTKITPLVPWPETDIIIEVTGLRDGEELGSAVFTLDGKTAGGLLEPARPVELPVAVTAPEMTDYRVDVLWGEQARRRNMPEQRAHEQTAPSQIVPPHASLVTKSKDATERAFSKKEEGILSVVSEEASNDQVRLADTSIDIKRPQGCATDSVERNCAPEFVYQANLSNLSPRTIDALTLEARFIGRAGVQGEPSEIDLENLAIQPGESRPISVTFEAPGDATGSPEAGATDLSRLVTPQLRVARVIYLKQ